MHNIRLQTAKKYSDRAYKQYQSCSCYMCGNPRKWFGERTRKEIGAEIDYKEQLEEMS